MSNREPSDPATRAVIERARRRRQSRRRLRLALAVLAALVITTTVVSAVVVTANSPSPRGNGSSSASGPTNQTVFPTSVTQPADTTEPAASSTSTNITDSGGPSPTTLTSAALTTTTTRATPTTAASPSARGRVVVIDPGHQAKGNYVEEPIGPGSSKTKPKVSSGTAGVVTGIYESELVLAVSLMLRDELEARGVKVIMTRTTQNVDISNIERTAIANQAGADLFIRVHADGTDNASVHGIHVLYPAITKGWTDDIAAASMRAAELVHQALIAATGAKDRGITARSDMTGFNWSDVPVIIPEIGFMTNPDEDRRLATAEYRRTIARALADGIVRFLNE